MTRPPVIVDTNVLISGLITGEPTAPTARILDGMLDASFSFLLSIDLLAEYRNVLLRPRLRNRHCLGAEEIDRILREIAANGILIENPPKPKARDSRTGDEHLWALLDAAPEALLVTGDRALQTPADEPKRVLSPREFLARMPAAGGQRPAVSGQQSAVSRQRAAGTEPAGSGH
jgi:uncharacterized protein